MYEENQLVKFITGPMQESIISFSLDPNAEKETTESDEMTIQRLIGVNSCDIHNNRVLSSFYKTPLKRVFESEDAARVYGNRKETCLYDDRYHAIYGSGDGFCIERKVGAAILRCSVTKRPFLMQPTHVRVQFNQISYEAKRRVFYNNPTATNSKFRHPLTSDSQTRRGIRMDRCEDDRDALINASRYDDRMFASNIIKYLHDARLMLYKGFPSSPAPQYVAHLPFGGDRSCTIEPISEEQAKRLRLPTFLYKSYMMGHTTDYSIPHVPERRRLTYAYKR